MNFSVYFDEQLTLTLDKVAKKMKRSRNSIIKEAVEEWVNLHLVQKWPNDFFDFEPVTDVPNFKAYRKELKSAKEDPLR